MKKLRLVYMSLLFTGSLAILGGCASKGGGDDLEPGGDSIATDNNTPYNTAPSPTEPRSGQLESGSWNFGSE